MMRAYVQQSLLVLLGLVLLGSIALGLKAIAPEATLDEVIREGGPAAAVRGSVLSESPPTRLRIPAIGVDTSFVTLGIDENREIEVPKSFTEVGWYEYGPTPGELGPAVVLGHVDSYEGPAVFFSLGQLRAGDRIEIDREDGSTAVFEVKTSERYPQSNFPTSLVYGDIDHAGLRLITCSGSYDYQSLRYDQNLVVYAELVEG